MGIPSEIPVDPYFVFFQIICMKYRQIQAAEIDFSGFMQYNEPEPEQSRCRCGMFTLNEIGSRKYRKGDAYVKRQDSSSRSIWQYSGV